MADDECIVLSDSDDEQQAAPVAKRARQGAAAEDGDIEFVDAQPAPLLADEGADDGSDDDEVRVVGTKGEVRQAAVAAGRGPAFLRVLTPQSARRTDRVEGLPAPALCVPEFSVRDDAPPPDLLKVRSAEPQPWSVVADAARLAAAAVDASMPRAGASALCATRSRPSASPGAMVRAKPVPALCEKSVSSPWPLA